MSRWYRRYTGTVSDPKIAEAALVAECSKAVVIATWDMILESAAETNESGQFRATSRNVAATLGEQIATIERVFSALESLEMIENGIVLAWSRRQFQSDSSTERSRKHRALRNGNGDATPMQRCATPPYTESDTDTERKDTPLPPDGGRVSQAVDQIDDGKPNPHTEALKAFEAYNARALVLGIPQASKLTPDRERRIRARLKDFGSDGWTKALTNLDTPFLRGLTEHRFRADLDFVCQAKSFSKLHDGGYEPAKPAPGVTHAADRNRTARYPTKHDRLQAVVAGCLERNAGPAARPDWARDLDGDALTIVPSA